MSLRRVFQRCARAVRFRLSWRGHFHSYQFADPAFFHRHAVKDIGLGDGALVVGDDDELALRDEAIQHPDKAIDVRLVERRIHFVEHAERTRPHHVNGKEKRDGRHGALAAAESSEMLCNCLPGGLAMISIPQLSASFSSIKRQIGAAAAEKLGKHLAEVDPHLRECFGEKFLASSN